MSIIAVFNPQRGVGATTTALNLLAGIAQRGQRPLAIDLDPAGDLTWAFGAPPARATDSVVAFFRHRQPLGDIAEITRSGVVLCPAHADLARLDAELGKGTVAITRLRRAVRRPGAVTGPVVIDCGPRIDVLSLNAVFACELLLVPVTDDDAGLHGARQVERAVRALEPVLKKPLPRRYLATRVDPARGHSAEEEIRRELATIAAAGGVCTTLIRECPELAESRAAGLDVFRHAPASAGAQDYLSLVTELADAGFFA
jgi:chromosome partitioning protein